MRCDDVIRELAARHQPEESAELAEHLETCADCAAWVERDAALRRIWEATRPAPPSDAAWETVWANVTESLERAPLVAVPRRRRRLVVFGLAQAAAVLIAVLVLSRHRDAGPEIARNTATSNATVDIEEGQFIVIHADGPEIRTESLALQESSNSVDVNLDFFNTIEPLAE